MDDGLPVDRKAIVALTTSNHLMTTIIINIIWKYTTSIAMAIIMNKL